MNPLSLARQVRSLPALTLILLAACSSPTGSDAGDASAAPDSAPDDVLVATDTPALDAPVTDDTPAPLDAPVATDTPVSPDAPTPIDAPSATDAMPDAAPDAPVITDAPTADVPVSPSGERDLVPPHSGPNPGSTGIAQLVPRPGGFFAIYEDDRSPVPDTHLGYRGARLTASLGVLDPSGMPLPVPTYPWHIRGAYDGAGIVLAYVDAQTDGTYAIGVSRITELGATLFAPRVIASSPSRVDRLVATYDGTRTLIAWLESGTGAVRAAGVDSNGAVSGPWMLAPAAQDVAIASSNGVSLAVWTVYRPGNASTVEGVRIPQGAAPPSTSSVIATRTATLFLDVTATSSGAWYVAWSETPMAGTQSIVGTAIGASGSPGALVPIDSTATMYAIAPRLGFSGTDVRVVWTVYLDIRSRTVPLAGAPTTPVNFVRMGLGSEPGARVACSASTCAASWGEAVAGVSLLASGRVTRLAPDSSALDVPALEISFPAEAQTAPLLAFDTQSWDVVFGQTYGRDPPNVLSRRLDANTGAWLDAAPAVLAMNREIAGVAASPTGGVVVATREPFLSRNYAIYGHDLATGGSVTNRGAWVTPFNRPQYVNLACATTRCGLLYESSQMYLSAVLDAAGNLLQASNVYVAAFGMPDFVHFRGAGTAFVAAWEGYQIPFRAAIAGETSFPTFGTPFALQTAATITNGDVHSAVQSGHVGLAWSGRNTCTIFARAIDTTNARAIGSDAVTLHDCTNYYASVVDVSPSATGFVVIYRETGAVGGTPFVHFYRRDVDSSMNPTAAEQLVTTLPAGLSGLALHRVANRDVYSYARFDDTPGVGSQRGKLLGL